MYTIETKNAKSPKIPSGFASHPDNAQAHAHVDQEKWLNKSKQTINKFVQKLPKDQATPADEKPFKSFEDAYKFLAKDRHRIASELGHGEKSGRIEDYGHLRGEMTGAVEEVYDADIPQSWSGMRKNLFALFDQLIQRSEEKNKYDKSKAGNYTFKDADCVCFKREQTTEDGKRFNIYMVTVKSPHKSQQVDGKNHSTTLATIHMREYTNKVDAATDPKFKWMGIEYAPINKYDQKGDFNLANRYYQAILSISESGKDKIESFLKHLGRLAHLLAHLLPVKLGNAGIMEWMMRGLAFKNGINLGAFNYSEGVSWDFKALLTPNREEYANWFYEKAFANIQLLTKEEIANGFLFINGISLTGVKGTLFSKESETSAHINPSTSPALLLHH